MPEAGWRKMSESLAVAPIELTRASASLPGHWIGSGAAEFEASQRHGVDSVAFDSWYPFSMEFRPAAGAQNCGYETTPALLALNALLVAGFLWLRPPKRVFFWTMITTFWWYCGLISPMGYRSVDTCFQYMGRFAYF
ncbi:unnamed protein product, partial [Symbiodinium sp. CCMP2456]